MTFIQNIMKKKVEVWMVLYFVCTYFAKKEPGKDFKANETPSPDKTRHFFP